MNHAIPNAPWLKVGTDLFSISGNHFVIVVDYYSSFFEIRRLKDKESPTVVEHTKKISGTHGIPLEVYSDSGPEFIAKECSIQQRLGFFPRFLKPGISRKQWKSRKNYPAGYTFSNADSQNNSSRLLSTISLTNAV